MLLTLQHVASRVLRDPDHRFGWVSLEYLLDGWVQDDGHDYLRIAEGGYWYVPGVESPVVWFPLYPLAIRSVGWVLDDPMLAGMVVASIGGLVGVGVYWKWLDRSGITGDARLVAFLFLVTYPYGWYLYGVVYADSVFVALVLCSFLLVEQGRHVLAGIAGAPATATRPTGLALIPALAVLAVERAGVLTVPAVVGEGRVGRAAWGGPCSASGSRRRSTGAGSARCSWARCSPRSASGRTWCTWGCASATRSRSSPTSGRTTRGASRCSSSPTTPGCATWPTTRPTR